MANRILKFSAAWCQPCRAMAAMLQRIQLPVELDEIDVDNDFNSASKYNIRGVPTLVLVDDQGIELSRLVGSKTEAEVKNWISNWPKSL